MGEIRARVVIRNPAEPHRAWEGQFLVDTGATDTLVPGPELEAIGLEPKGRRKYQLADGQEAAFDVTTADIELMGEVFAGIILYGSAEADPLLGVTVLESAGLKVDPRNQTLEKLAIRL